METLKKLMIKSLLAGILIFIMLLAVGCDEKEETKLPDFSQPNWESKYDSILRVQGGTAELLSRTDPGVVELRINGVDSAWQATYFDHDISMYRCSLGNAGLDSGASLAYDLNFAGGHSTGFLKVPWPINPVFPSFGEGNYSFEWSISVEPQLYLVDFTWVLQSVPGRIKEQLSGRSLTHTINKELWGGSVIYPDNLSLHAINISRSDSALLVYSETVAQRQF